jgi:hypothetical protein
LLVCAAWISFLFILFGGVVVRVYGFLVMGQLYGGVSCGGVFYYKQVKQFNYYKPLKYNHLEV